MSNSPLSVDSALLVLLPHAPEATVVETVPCLRAQGRVLASDQVAERDVPFQDNSAMDGYAIRAHDNHPAGQSWLPVQQSIAAGRTGVELAPGCAARILTGAAIPPGADAVVMQELCEIQDTSVRIRSEVPVGQNIRFRGEDIAAGDTVLNRGTHLRPPEIALVAAMGLAELPVFRKPRIAVFSTGAEIIEPGGALRPGQVFDSNRYTLISLIRSIGCEALDCGHLADDLEQTRTGIRSAAGQVDMIITSGGVSVGDQDFVRQAIEAEGQLHLWQVAIKPGKPVAFGSVGKIPIFGLPGNPVAVFITFLVLVRPFLRRMLGHLQLQPKGVRIPAAFSTHPAPYRCRYLRGLLGEDQSGSPRVELHDQQGSAMLRSLSWADGLVEIPEGESVKPGQAVKFLPFSELLC